MKTTLQKFWLGCAVAGTMAWPVFAGSDSSGGTTGTGTEGGTQKGASIITEGSGNSTSPSGTSGSNSTLGSSSKSTSSVSDQLFQRLDANGDGQLSKEEFSRISTLLGNGGSAGAGIEGAFGGGSKAAGAK